jgi:hypothetical protein
MLLGGEDRRTTETYLSATLSSTNLTWSGPESNPDLCGERSATNRVIQARLADVIVPPCYSLTSLLIRAVQIGEISELDWLQPEYQYCPRMAAC